MQVWLAGRGSRKEKEAESQTEAQRRRRGWADRDIAGCVWAAMLRDFPGCAAGDVIAAGGCVWFHAIALLPSTEYTRWPARHGESWLMLGGGPQPSVSPRRWRSSEGRGWRAQFPKGLARCPAVARISPSLLGPARTCQGPPQRLGRARLIGLPLPQAHDQSSPVGSWR